MAQIQIWFDHRDGPYDVVTGNYVSVDEAEHNLHSDPYFIGANLVGEAPAVQDHHDPEGAILDYIEWADSELLDEPTTEDWDDIPQV